MPKIEEVTPIKGERWSFNVHSSSRPGMMWRVDLEGFKWNGHCPCENFMFNHAPTLTRGAAPSDEHRCRHIKRARSYVMEVIFPMIAARMVCCPTPMDRGREAIASIEAMNDLVALRQFIDQKIDNITNESEPETNPEPGGEPRRPSPKIYNLESRPRSFV